MTVAYQDSITVLNITMASMVAVNGTHDVHFYPEDASLEIIGDTDAMSFTNANWNTPQKLKVKCTKIGTFKIKAVITASYHLPGHSLEHEITLEVQAFPDGNLVGSAFDAYIFTDSGWSNAEDGDLAFYFTNNVVHNVLDFYIDGGAVTGQLTVTEPDGTVTTAPLTSFEMLQTGNYIFRIACALQQGDSGDTPPPAPPNRAIQINLNLSSFASGNCDGPAFYYHADVSLPSGTELLAFSTPMISNIGTNLTKGPILPVAQASGVSSGSMTGLVISYSTVDTQVTISGTAGPSSSGPFCLVTAQANYNGKLFSSFFSLDLIR